MHHKIVNRRAQRGNAGRITRRMYPVGAEHHGNLPFQVKPQTAAGKAEMPDRAAGKKIAGRRLTRRRRIPTQRSRIAGRLRLTLHAFLHQGSRQPA